MKKLILSFITMAFLLVVLPSNLKANEDVKSAKESETLTEVKAELNKMVDRVAEINEMDLKALSKDERKEMKRELRGIKKDFKKYSKSDNPAVSEAAAEAVRASGVYISGGALLVIIILLILL
ncbi:hypothetical protein [Draconibacterium halophilum]|uniref:Uncharacterized protein n=1 Tax=Draconibacterium halophilum TaxID=2706887 RepID=A0A6C0RF55_9BACT|nr:hypothetical protein [Draconibacterium halophilum]QIA09338.1 hypothetical protein G0Q07_17210 [Draconibacterium halophilum]